MILQELMENYQDWERDIIDILISKYKMPNGDAQSLVDVNSFSVRQGWSGSYSPEMVADKIMKQ